MDLDEAREYLEDLAAEREADYGPVVVAARVVLDHLADEANR